MAGDIQQANDRTVSTDGLQVTLWSRQPVCGPRTVAIDRLSELGAAGALDGFEIQTWPDQVVVSGSDTHDDLLAKVEQFERWAAERGMSLRPPFERRTVGSLVGESREVLAMPMLLAAVREDGDLVGVYPCTDGDRTWTVTELLDALAAEEGLPLDGG